MESTRCHFPTLYNHIHDLRCFMYGLKATCALCTLLNYMIRSFVHSVSIEFLNSKHFEFYLKVNFEFSRNDFGIVGCQCVIVALRGVQMVASERRLLQSAWHSLHAADVIAWKYWRTISGKI